MMSLLPMSATFLETLLGAAFVALVLVWVQWEKRLKGTTGLWRRTDRRTVSATTMLVSLIFLVLATASLRSFWGHLVTVILGTATVGGYFMMNPDKPGFWQHRRMRWPIAGFFAGILLAVSLALPNPVWVPCLAAMVIFHHHFLTHIALERHALNDLGAMAQKIQKLETELDMHKFKTHKQASKSDATVSQQGA